MSSTAQTTQTNEPFDLEREPLDRPDGFEIDWGGDGTDLERPVRAHVLVALRPPTGSYAPPLDALLALGDIDAATLERRAAELNIGQGHVPELIRMLRDRALNTADSDNPAVWAPSHALRLLARLDIAAHAAELTPIFDLDFELLTDELIDILPSAGGDALAPLAAYVRDRSRWAWGRSRAADALGKLAEQHPELREQVVTILSEVLAGAEDDHEDTATGVMGTLLELKAAETLPLIRRAFELGKIDESVYGPWGDVLEELGAVPDPDDPLIEESRLRFEERHRQMFPQSLRDSLAALQEREHQKRAVVQQRAASQKRKQQARKEKNKRKAASASRKANRKKRK